MSGAPLPLLGTFHELSLAVHDVPAAVEFFERLGFTQASTGDTYAHPYGVLTDGRLFIGVHGRRSTTPTLTFVRPNLERSVSQFTDAGIQLTVCRTGEAVFNEVAFADPAGQAIAVLEARTYSPVDRSARETSLCGEFTEVSLPTADFEAARAFWEPLGFVAATEEEAPFVHLPLTSDYLDVSFHRPRVSEVPLAVFQAPDMERRLATLRAGGVACQPLPKAVRAGGALLEAPGELALLLLAGEP